MIPFGQSWQRKKATLHDIFDRTTFLFRAQNLTTRHPFNDSRLQFNRLVSAVVPTNPAHPPSPFRPQGAHTPTMADDTRQSPSSSEAAPTVQSLITAPPAQPPAQRAPANVMPGGTAHTAGGEKVDSAGPSYLDVARNLPADYYLNFHKRPCVRESQLTGIGVGFVGGSLAAVMRSTFYPHFNYQHST
jgi:hypothetical protein